MTESKDISEEINKKINNIRNEVITGKISLLDLELVPIFDDLKTTLNIKNLDKYSNIYKEACGLLNQKFDELKILLSSLDHEEKFLKYLKSNPSDLEISMLFEGCWFKPYIIDMLSVEYLEDCKNKLCKERAEPISIEHLEKIKVNEDFLLEIPQYKFSDKMNSYFNKVKDKLPCSVNEIFEDEEDQIKIYENFVYLLHLIQLGKIKYQKDTKILYL